MDSVAMLKSKDVIRAELIWQALTKAGQTAEPQSSPPLSDRLTVSLLLQHLVSSNKFSPCDSAQWWDHCGPYLT